MKLRANTARSGTVREVTPNNWFCVDWDDGVVRPKIVHQFGLMTLPIDGSVKNGVEKNSTVSDPRAG